MDGCKCDARAALKITHIVNDCCSATEQAQLVAVFTEAIRQMPSLAREAWFDLNKYSYLQNTTATEFACTIARHEDGTQWRGLFSTTDKSLEITGVTARTL